MADFRVRRRSLTPCQPLAAGEPEDRLLRIHQAELQQKSGELSRALSLYVALLEESEDPFLNARAFILAQTLDRPVQAKHHFERAESEFLMAIATGEVYTLGALARLYTAANVKLDAALELARLNLQYKRDREARAVLQRLKDQ